MTDTVELTHKLNRAEAMIDQGLLDMPMDEINAVQALIDHEHELWDRCEVLGARIRKARRKAARRSAIEQVVSNPEDACPDCGEARIDYLVWDDDEKVTCASCGCVYVP